VQRTVQDATRTHKYNECPNPICSIVLIYMGSLEIQYLYMTERIYWHFKIIWV